MFHRREWPIIAVTCVLLAGCGGSGGDPVNPPPAGVNPGPGVDPTPPPGQPPPSQPPPSQPPPSQPPPSQPPPSQPPPSQPPPTAAGCKPDIAIPSVGDRTWPDSCNTGASDSLGALETVNGDVILSQPGQTYSNKRVKGTIAVTACDVTIENVEVDVGSPFKGDSTEDLYAIWLQQDGSCGATLDHVSVITQSAPNNYVTWGVRDARGGPLTVTNSKIIGVQMGIYTGGSGVIRDNYVRIGPNMRASDHNEGVEDTGSDGLTFSHNTMLNGNLQTSALSLFTDFGPNHNMIVDDNLLAGGGYTCYCGDGLSDHNGSPTPASNVSVTNNVFWRLFYSGVGYYGDARAYRSDGGGQWLQNFYMNANGALTTDLVPQPPPDGQ